MKLSYRRLTLPTTPHQLRRLGHRMRRVRAAGCLVADADGRLLLILRGQRWDLPKGKVEPGETLRAAAMRETLEETGIVATASTTPLLKTYHIYNLYGGWHLKQTSWFFARTEAAAPPTVPQADEGIEACRWATPAEAQRLLATSYGTLRLLARAIPTLPI